VFVQTSWYLIVTSVTQNMLPLLSGKIASMSFTNPSSYFAISAALSPIIDIKLNRNV